jgi:hypothetical protein
MPPTRGIEAAARRLRCEAIWHFQVDHVALAHHPTTR